MPKKRAVIVDHHRDKRLQLAAALKGPDLIIVMIESEQELFADTEPTDLFVLRADMDRSSGYSMCNRLRSNERTLRSKIVIVAPNASDPRLQQHKSSPQPANAYIAPPLGLKDLRLQAYSLLDLDGGTVADDDIQAVEDDPFAAIDRALSEDEGTAKAMPMSSGNPAEVQAQPKPEFSDDDLEGAFGALTPDQKPKVAAPVEEVLEADEVMEAEAVHEVPVAAAVPTPLSQLSEEELKFVEGVFERVKTMPNAPPLPPGVKSAKDLRGPEAKIYMLREQLRERELELQRLRQTWLQHEHEYKTSAQRVAEMEIEVKAAQMGQEEAMKRAKMRDDELRREQKGSSSAIDRLLEEKFILEKDLIEIVASKEKVVAELKRNVAARERDIETLKKEKAAVEEELVRTRAADDAALAQARAEADAALTQTRAEAEALLNQTRTDAEALLLQTRTDAEARFNQARSDAEMLLNQTREEAAKQLFDLTQSSQQTLTDTINRTDEERKNLQLEMQTDRDIAASKLADAEANFAERLRVLEEQKRTGEREAAAMRATLETKVTELQEGAAQRDSQIAALREDIDRKDKNGMDQAQQLGELRVRLESLEAGSSEKLNARAQELEAAKREREEMQARLTERLQQREAAVAQKDAVLEQLGKELQVAREEKDALTKKLGDRLAEREKTITEMDERYASMQVEKIQVEERLRVMLEERARLERLMAPEAEANDSAPAAPAPQSSDTSHDEESIPIADSNESALMGGSKKAV